MSIKTLSFGIGSLGVALVVAATPSNAILNLAIGWGLVLASFAAYTFILRAHEESRKIVILKALQWILSEALISNTANFAVALETGLSPPVVLAIHSIVTLILLAAILLLQFELWISGLTQPHDID